MFASNLSSIAALHARQGLASADFRFTVPKSPIRSDGVRIAGESQPATLASDSFITLDVRRMPAFHSYAPSPGRRLREDELPGGDPDADRTRKGVEKAPESRPSSSADSGQENVRNRDEAEDDETRRIGRETDAGGEPLDDVEQVELDKLQERDREVRRHEQAHKAAAGRYAGAISYEYSQGPDGKRYAVGGEVGIDISPEKDPEATIAKMRQIKAAATAPAEPSPQDRAVAAEASRIEMRARQECGARPTKNRRVTTGRMPRLHPLRPGRTTKRPGSRRAPVPRPGRKNTRRLQIGGGPKIPFHHSATLGAVPSTSRFDADSFQ